LCAYFANKLEQCDTKLQSQRKHVSMYRVAQKVIHYQVDRIIVKSLITVSEARFLIKFEYKLSTRIL